MSELHKFIFDGMAVRGMIVRLTDAWTEILARRAANESAGAYPPAVRDLLGEMTAAAALMQSNIKFNGAVVLQIFGEGPVKLAVVEVQHDLSLRATASVVGEVSPEAGLSQLVNAHNGGRCAVTLDPKGRVPGQQPYQGVVPLYGDHGEKIERFSAVIEHYMLQSEQLDTTLVLAADDKVAAGLLIQRLPVEGEGNLAPRPREDEIGQNEDYKRIAMLAATLKREELLTLDVDTILHRLFWEEKVLRYEPSRPRFACTCSAERVSAMLKGLGRPEVDDILAEQGRIEISCDFCGKQYRFDPVDAARIFAAPRDLPPTSEAVQ